jgi:hypothetical protein
METTQMIDIEAELAADEDGVYQAELIARLEQHRDALALYQQELLTPDEHKVAAAIEKAVCAALTIIHAHKPAQSASHPTPDPPGAPWVL